jgi:hypothetical protein
VLERAAEWVARFTRRHPIVSSIVLVAGSVTVGLLVASQLTGKPRETLQSAAITLVYVALGGGLVKILLDDFQRGREERAEQARLLEARLAEKRAEQVRFTSAVLADLKAVYDRVERARIVLGAHRSAKTYGDEMRDLIDARVQLLNVERALKAGTSGISAEREEGVRSAVDSMEQYLARLTDEFHLEYKEISDEQRVHEARIKKLLDSVDDSTRLPENKPWDAIRRLDGLSDFIDGPGYRASFVDPLDNASRLLREELQELLAVTRPPGPTRSG